MKRQRWLVAASLLLAMAFVLLLNVTSTSAAPAVLRTEIADTGHTIFIQNQKENEPQPHRLLTGIVTTTDSLTTTSALTIANAQFVQGASGNLHLPFVFNFLGKSYLPFVAKWTSEFSNPWPAHSATRRSLNSYLTWDFDESRFPVTHYAVLLAPNDPTPDVLLAMELTKRQVDPYTFEPDTDYYWQVIAYDAAGRETRSPVWHFRTDYFPETPELGTMVEVPEGEFFMGCDPANPGYDACLDNEVPLHPIYLDAFSIDKFEVTNVEYRACVAAGVCKPPRKFGTHLDDPYYDNPEYDYFPVLFVSNWDARDYCGWVDKRLPTEAEWEKAARGAIDTRPWPWGMEHWDCSRMNRCTAVDDWFPTPVDSFVRNQSPYGAVNMSGNTHEWVQDFYLDDYYSWSPYYNPVNVVSQLLPYYSVRGGGYHDNWWYARTSHRNAGHHGDDGGSHDAPLFRSFRVGIRCAR